MADLDLSSGGKGLILGKKFIRYLDFTPPPPISGSFLRIQIKFAGDEISTLRYNLWSVVFRPD